MATTEQPQKLLDYEKTYQVLEQTFGYKSIFDDFIDEYRKSIRLKLEDDDSVKLFEQDREVLKMWVGDVPTYEELESLNEDAANISHYLSMRMCQLECAIPLVESEEENSHKHTPNGHKYGRIERDAERRYHALKDSKKQLERIIDIVESYDSVPSPSTSDVKAEAEEQQEALNDVELPEEYWPLNQPQTF